MKRHSKEEIDAAVSDYVGGMEISDVCKKYNLAYGTVQTWLIKRGCIRNYSHRTMKTGSRIKQNYIMYDDHAEIELKRRGEPLYVKIDLDDVDKCKNFGIWSVSGNDYIMSRSVQTGETVYLHRFVMGLYKNDTDKQVDHIYHDLLDCRKSQLRIVNNTKNLMNQHTRHDNMLGIRGIYYDKSRDKWMSRLNCYGQHFGKRFNTLDEAINYRNSLEEKHFGEYRFRGDVS